MDPATISLLLSVVTKYAPTLIAELLEVLKKKGIQDSDFDKILDRINKDLYDKT